MPYNTIQKYLKDVSSWVRDFKRDVHIYAELVPLLWKFIRAGKRVEHTGENSVIHMFYAYRKKVALSVNILDMDTHEATEKIWINLTFHPCERVDELQR